MIFTKNKMNGTILLLKNSIGFRYFTGTSLTFRPKKYSRIDWINIAQGIQEIIHFTFMI